MIEFNPNFSSCFQKLFFAQCRIKTRSAVEKVSPCQMRLESMGAILMEFTRVVRLVVGAAKPLTIAIAKNVKIIGALQKQVHSIIHIKYFVLKLTIT